MKALVLTESQTWPQLQDFELGELPEGFVSLKVSAAALNRRDYFICKGKYPGIQYPIILGSDVCGLVEGEKMIVNPGFDWGHDERVQSKNFNILGLPKHGALAEEVHVPKDALFAKPAHLTDEQAAALPLAGVTAYRALFTRAGLKKEEKVLVSGAGGGVGSMALLMSVAAGSEVYVTSGEESKIKRSIKLGARGGTNYREEGWSDELMEMSGGFDVIIDSAGGEGFSDLVKLLNPGGRIVFYGGTHGPITKLSPQLIFWRQLSLMGSTMGSPADFREMLQFVSDYGVVPVVDDVFSFEEGEKAFTKMEDHDQFGKIVLKP